MPTHCSQDSFDFGTVEGREVVAAFDGGAISSNGGGLLLKLAAKATGLIDGLAAAFRDLRDPDAIVHSLPAMLMQRVAGIALGYEDVNDHDRLRHDPVLALMAGAITPARANCAPLASKSTLNRLEHRKKVGQDPYHKIDYDAGAIERLFVTQFIKSHAGAPRRLVLDLDATHDPIHGLQEGRHFSAFYDGYCYLPLYVFCGRRLLAAKLRSADKDAADGATEEVARIVAELRKAWPGVQIIIRADSGFAREELMAWCEKNGVDYILGLAKNPRLVAAIRHELSRARRASAKSGKAERVYTILERWQTRESWSRARRVVAKAEWLGDKANPRFLVTSLGSSDARELYEDLYCQRGEMENRIKECQLDLFADRTSAATMEANQLRLWFAAFAYELLCALRRIGLAGTELGKATCGTIRLKLLKIGALVKVSVRRVKVAFASACPEAELFALAHRR